ncbi:MAG: class I SAM-dependent methyltransferase, partial [Pontibacterium sp.]
MITATTFWDKIADKYAKHPIKDMAAYEHKLAKTREYFTPNAQVLEFGCGTGSTALLHAPYVKAYRAIDISPRMIDIAKSKPLPAEPCALSFETSSLEALDASPETYDAILGLSILHLLEDPD